MSREQQDKLEELISRLDPLLTESINRDILGQAYTCFLKVGRNHPEDLKRYLRENHEPDDRLIIYRYYRLISEL